MNKQPIFKVGDRVRVVKESGFSPEIVGKFGTVALVYPSENLFSVQIDGGLFSASESFGWNFFLDDLELFIDETLSTSVSTDRIAELEAQFVSLKKELREMTEVVCKIADERDWLAEMIERMKPYLLRQDHDELCNSLIADLEKGPEVRG